MGATTIKWCDFTFNPWRGCQKVSPGCAHCYAETMSKRNPAVLGEWGPNGARVVAAKSYWRMPLKWDREAQRSRESWEFARQTAVSEYDQVEPYVRPRVFCASLADFAEERPELVEPRRRLFELIGQTPNLDWLLLTKRPAFALEHWPLWSGYAAFGAAVAGLKPDLEITIPNVWLGVSVEDQQRADERIPLLLQTPAAVRFLSVEPLLGPVDLARPCQPSGDVMNGLCGWTEAKANGGARVRGVDWVIAGGESGPRARPCVIGWIRDLVWQCQAARVPVFVKQLGSNAVEPIGHWGNERAQRGNWIASQEDGRDVWRFAGRDRKGGDPSEWPEDLRVRHFPEVRRCD